ncbi:MAG: hypothetical protein KIT22_03285 [Verrucomicrobiae bacterium]|nr:hypothetical protein [Verrucomicrobiae bacterium]
MNCAIAPWPGAGLRSACRLFLLLPLLPLAPASFAAAPFAYRNGDLIACFRADGGASDLVVNLGPAASFEGLPWGGVTPITALDPVQLNAAFPTLEGVRWSVLGVMRGNTDFPQFPLHTVWVTSANPEPGVLGPVWKRQGPFTQGPVGSQIEAIGAGALVYGSQQPGGPNNTETGILVSSTDPNSYSMLVTEAGNLADTFQGSVENRTPEGFLSGQAPSRSLLYKLEPSAGGPAQNPGHVLGWFDFAPDGSLSFVAGPLPTAVSSVQRTGDVTSVSFTSVPPYSYRLRFTDAAGLASPISEWSAGGQVAAGDGTVQTLQATSTEAIQFYVVEVLP